MKQSLSLTWKILLVSLLLLVASPCVWAQSSNTKADHDWQGTTRDYVHLQEQRSVARTPLTRDRLQLRWLDDALTYRVNTGPKTFEYFRVELKTGEKKKVASLPDQKGNKSIESLRESVDRGGEVFLNVQNKTKETVRLIWINRSGGRQIYGEIKPGKSRKQHTFAGHVWLVENLKRQPMALFEASDESPVVITPGLRVKLKEQREPSRRQRSRNRYSAISPNGNWKAIIRNHNVFLENRKAKKEVQLSTNGTPKNTYGGRFYWSPDSKKLVVMRTQPAASRTVSMIESSPKDQLQPKLHQMQYLKPGDDVRRQRPHLFDVKEQKPIPVDDKLFNNPYQIRDADWSPDGSEFRFLYNQRGHQVLRYIGIDGETGSARAIINEESETFVDYAGKYFLRKIEESDELIWMSERDGWNHLYLIDASTGQIKNQITKGKWVVRGVEQIDVENRKIYFRASGWKTGQDPYLMHFGHVSFDGTDLVRMTDANGNHTIEYAPDRRHFVATYSRVDLPPVTELRRTEDGKRIAKLESAEDESLRKKGWCRPEPFVAKGRDGKTDIHGVIYFPSNMDSDRTYPVVEYIYAGPHSSFVPKSYFRYRSEKALAELGFIVVQIDGMGTSNRSKAFHDICWKNLGDSGFPDRIEWMKSAKRKHPQMDLSRVGIYGGSAGGQSALRAMLAHGDFYKAAVSDCGCHDNRMDKIWWNELWMSWPIGPHYKEQSNVTNAHRLQGKLLLIVGELDRNVDPASTMQVVDALIKADKDFDLLVVPGGGHGIGSSKYGMRRTRDFFVRHLIGKEPRSKP